MLLKEWAAFAAAGILWGTSFLWIKIALGELSPLGVAAGRLSFGVAALWMAKTYLRQKFPRDPKTLRSMAILSVMNPAIPFFLISWGETRIDTGLASILNGTVPLFTTVLAHVLLNQEERITRARMLGLLSAFFGVVILVSRDFTSSGAHQSDFWGQLAVLTASAVYGYAGVFARKNLRGLSPVAQATGVMTFALVWISVILFGVNQGNLSLPVHGMTWLAIGWLGILGTCTAFLCYFYLLNAWGPTRASLVNYVFPVVGLMLGIIFRGEHVDWHLIAGSVLIVGGIALVNVSALRHRFYARKSKT